MLVVDDEEAIREVLAVRLAGWGYEVSLAEDVASAERVALTAAPNLVLSDVVLPDATGFELLRRLKSGDAERPVVMMTAHGSIDAAVEAMKLGAHDFLTKPLDYEKLRAVLDDLLEDAAERRRGTELDATLDRGAGFGPMVGQSEAMRAAYSLVEAVAKTDATVIVTGETGTGKEVIARTVHARSRRSSGPFVAVNVAAIPETLVESELFGHERGAFTGAVAARAGCFELADGGTLLLDEITEMPTAMQPKLLRVLEEGRLRRVGGSREIGFDVRVIAASNRDPRQAIADGRLREDLFYRLSVFNVALPPLRERGEDLHLLTRHFIRQFNDKHATAVTGVSRPVRMLLSGYAWPGNVRELRNVIERAVIVASRGLIRPSHLPPFLREGTSGAGRETLEIPASATAAEAERILILQTLERVGNNKAEAARQLGLDVKTIRNKLKQYGGDGS